MSSPGATSPPSPLRSPKLRRIVLAYTINRLGTWFGFIALSLAVFDHTHSALAVAALLVIGQIIPAFLTPALVARVEASSQRGALSALYLFEAVTTAALAALLLWSFSLPGILLLVALDETAALAASALLRAEAARAAREWVGEASSSHAMEAERRANAALNVGFAGTFVLGPVLAGLVVAAYGSPAALLIDTASFVACAAMVIDLRPHITEAENVSVRARVRAAWEHIVAAPVLRGLLLVEGCALVFFASDGSIEVPYAKATLHAGDGGYGLIVTMWGVGAVIGSIVFARAIRRPLGTILSGGALAIGVAYLGWAFAPTLALACVAGVIGGFGNGVQWAAFISAVQSLTPPDLQGRMMGAVESLGAIFPALGLALGGALVALSSPRGAFLVVGLGAALSTIAFVRLRLGAPRSETPAQGANDSESRLAPVPSDSPGSSQSRAASAP